MLSIVITIIIIVNHQTEGPNKQVKLKPDSTQQLEVSTTP